MAAAQLHSVLVVRQHDVADDLARRLPLPQLRLPFVFAGDIGPREIDRLANDFAAAVTALPAVET